MLNEQQFLFQDRIQKIRQIYKEYDLENVGYISFSGGKDSVIVSKLFDLAIPENRLPRVFCNTGLEYTETVKYVKRCAETDSRIKIILPRYSVKTCFSEYGYPFKSKYHAHLLNLYQRNPNAESALKYVHRGDHSQWACPDKLIYQFSPDFKLKVSDKCCYKLKKEPFTKYSKETGRTIGITGMRRAEKGLRNDLPCLSFRREKLHLFSPLAPCNNEFEFWFIKEFNVILSPLYYEPFNFQRTGCIGCPFAVHVKEQLEIMKEKIPQDYKRAINLFSPVYEEYARIGYRGFEKNDLRVRNVQNPIMEGGRNE